MLEQVVAVQVEVDELSSGITVDPPTAHRVAIWGFTILPLHGAAALNSITVTFRITVDRVNECLVHAGIVSYQHELFKKKCNLLRSNQGVSSVVGREGYGELVGADVCHVRWENGLDDATTCVDKERRVNNKGACNSEIVVHSPS